MDQLKQYERALRAKLNHHLKHLNHLLDHGVLVIDDRTYLQKRLREELTAIGNCRSALAMLVEMIDMR